jgi:rhamnosyl/mannosyltransferase
MKIVRAGTFFTAFFTPISPAFPFRLRQMIKASRPDLLHLHLPNPSAFWSLLLPSARRRPWIVHWHSDVITTTHGWGMNLLYALYRPFERAVLKRAHTVIVTSEPYLAASEPLRPWKGKCRVAPLGIDSSRFGNLSALPAGERRGGLRLLYVGRLTYYKGVRFLLDALSKVDNVTLDLVGGGEEETGLRALAASLGLEARAHFHGPLPDRELAGLMAGCDCLCLPSIERTEAFGLVLAEAMFFGKATLIGDVPGSGMGWIVDQERTGLKVPPADTEALAGALRLLRDNPDKTVRMGAEGRRKFESMFDINAAAVPVWDIYRSVLEGSAQDLRLNA